MVTIDKKAIPNLPELKKAKKVDMERRCENCAVFHEGWCQLHQHTTNAINYGCKTHMTKEEFEEKMKKATAYLDSQDGIRVNYMLTLMFAMVSASYQIIIRGESMLGNLIGGKEWRFERKKALKDIMQDIQHIKSLYSTYFEKDYIQLMSEYGKKEFDAYKYDGFQMFAGDFLMLGLTLFEHGYNYEMPDVIDELIEWLRQKPAVLELFPPKFVDQFKIKRSND